LKKIKPINKAALLISLLFSSYSFSEYNMRVDSIGMVPLLHSNPKTCVSILVSGRSIGDGNYMVDPDGAGGNVPKSAYCLMSAGGFMLYDSFASNTGGLGNTPNAYNKKSISSINEIISAGYEHHLFNINDANYHIDSQYLQMFWGSSPNGTISKLMPSWSSAIRVDMSNEWHNGKSSIVFNNNNKTFSSYETRKEVVISGSGMLTLTEIGSSIIWLDAIWVK